MNRVLTVLFTTSLLATAAMADTGANERFRMKNGRDLPSVEQARSAAADLARERVGYVAPATPAKATYNDNEVRFYMKNGRFTPQEETRLATLAAPSEPVRLRGVSPAHNDAEERFYMKNGRHTPGKTS